jgi:hypothetical protein
MRTHTTAAKWLVTTVTMLVLAAPTAAGAAPAPGGQEGINSQNSGRSAANGPASPGLRWTSDLLQGRDVPRNHALILDSVGHVLIQVRRENPAGPGAIESLVAVNRSDGSIAWELDDIVNSCEVAATGGGVIYAHLVPRSPTGGPDNFNNDLVAIDAATGQLIPGMRYSPPETPDEPRLQPCADGLRLLPDDTVVLAEPSPGIRGVRAIGPTAGGDALEQKWLTVFPDADRAAGRPPVSVDGNSVYVAWVETVAPRSPKVSRLNAASGAVEQTATLPGNRFTLDGQQGDAFLVDPGGGIVVNTRTFPATDSAWVTRLDANLGQVWQRSILSGDPVFGSGLGFASMVATGDQLVGWYTGRALVASLDQAIGATRWTVTPGSFSNNEGRILADAAGNTYWSTFGDNYLESVDSTGSLRWVVPQCALGSTVEASIVGPIDSDGALYTVSRVQVSGAPDHHVIHAFSSDSALPSGTCPEGPGDEGAERLSGADRFDTALSISRAAFPGDGSADVVVLSRADEFADALAGTPLAVEKNGPLLITPRTQLHEAVRAEIVRLLGNDMTKTVYLLGGEAALSGAVEAAVGSLGYRVRRIFGPGRIETAIEIARELDALEAFLITTGFNFPDALAAGVAAAHARGAVLLTFSELRADQTDAFMGAHPNVPRFAIGGPAARPYPEATPVFGATRAATAVAVAQRFFTSPTVVGVARQDTFPDSLSGGAHIAQDAPELGRRGGPMLLTATNQLLAPVGDYLCTNASSLQTAFIYGGSSAVSSEVAAQIGDRVQGRGC